MVDDAGDDFKLTLYVFEEPEGVSVTEKYPEGPVPALFAVSPKYALRLVLEPDFDILNPSFAFAGTVPLIPANDTLKSALCPDETDWLADPGSTAFVPLEYT